MPKQRGAGQRKMGRRVAWAATSTTLMLVGTLGLTSCGTGAGERTPTSTSSSPVPATTAPSASTSSPVNGALQPVSTPKVIVSNLDAPWSMVRLAGGSTLISERDTAKILELQANGFVREVGTIAGVHPDGEAGLLGLAVLPGEGSGTTWLYAYFTAADDNRVVRMHLEGAAGSYALDEPEVILRGIPKAGNHDGGRLKFGPDGMLYVTAGDASSSAHAQNLNTLGGKILRLQPDGQVPPNNPFPGSHVYSWGHRNPQGIAWTSDGTMWASEFGQNTWDELNIIVPGGNYGWPDVEGKPNGDGDGGGDGGDGGASYIDPVLVWRTSDASPSGMAVVGDTLFMAGLGGRRLWVIDPDDAATGGKARDVAFYTDEYGRIRDVVPGPHGSLWFMTNNTDSRGTPTAGDDRIYQVQLNVTNDS